LGGVVELQMVQCPRLELTGALTGDTEALSHIVERPRLAVFEAVAESQYRRLVVAEVVHEVSDFLPYGAAGGALTRIGIALVGDEVGQFTPVSTPHRKRE
jgi:hypothetical protein